MPTPSGIAKQETLTEVRDALLEQAVPTELRLDYDTRTDKQPVYLGKAMHDVANEANPVWTVTRFTYESTANDARLVSSDVRTNVVWNDRATGW